MTIRHFVNWQIYRPFSVEISIRIFVWLLLGIAIGMSAWGYQRTPLLAILVPILIFAARDRSEVFFFALAYHATVVRFLPPYANQWFEGKSIGPILWIALAASCAIPWSLSWSNSQNNKIIGLGVMGSFVLSIIPPIGIIIPGHPIIGWGFVLPGWGWWGLLTGILASALSAIAVRKFASCSKTARQGILIFGVAIVAVLIAASFTQTREDGKQTAIGFGLDTAWGSRALTPAEEKKRLEEAVLMATSHSRPRVRNGLVVLPETTIGLYDASSYEMVDQTLGELSRTTGLSVLFGAEIALPNHKLKNAALLISPDGPIKEVSQRQPTVVSMWHPWSPIDHFPANWKGENILNIGLGIRARIMFCYEEYLPILHLLNEIYDDHEFIIAIANGWAARDMLASTIQSTHTEGMARLFGRTFLRAENYRLEVYRQKAVKYGQS